MTETMMLEVTKYTLDKSNDLEWSTNPQTNPQKQAWGAEIYYGDGFYGDVLLEKSGNGFNCRLEPSGPDGSYAAEKVYENQPFPSELEAKQYAEALLKFLGRYCGVALVKAELGYSCHYTKWRGLEFAVLFENQPFSSEADAVAYAETLLRLDGFINF